MNSHLISLTFDDGFAKSGMDLAKIFEEAGLRTSLNVIARGPDPDYQSPDEWHNAPRGSWDLWNELLARGHEVNPHGLDHSDPHKLPAGEAARRVDQCIDIFRKSLRGFDPMKSVFACPYNALTPELEGKLAESFRAYRAGRNWVNPLPSRATRYIGCWSDGPGNADATLEDLINKFLDSPGGWLVAAMHGLDKEGWGPLSSGYLRKLLERLLKDKRVEVIGVTAALIKYGQG
jgi:peptidoglycan/xylan/chitin deacetylase (PgdA/CDA1 family)